jgi:hypothetical protein
MSLTPSDGDAVTCSHREMSSSCPADDRSWTHRSRWRPDLDDRTMMFYIRTVTLRSVAAEQASVRPFWPQVVSDEEVLWPANTASVSPRLDRAEPVDPLLAGASRRVER